MRLQRLVGTASMRSMTFLQVDRCSNEPFSTYCVYCVFYKLILRILRILQIVILEYCVYCVFYKLTSANIAYIAYIALRILRNIALRCVFYNKPSQKQRRILACFYGVFTHMFCESISKIFNFSRTAAVQLKKEQLCEATTLPFLGRLPIARISCLIVNKCRCV